MATIAYIDLKMLLSQSLQRLSNITTELITIDAAIDLVGSPKQTEQQPGISSSSSHIIFLIRGFIRYYEICSNKEGKKEIISPTKF